MEDKNNNKMTTPAFYIQKTQDLESQREAFFKIGVPCERGKWWSTDTIGLLTPFGLIKHYTVEVLSLWHDGSIKWLLVQGFTEVNSDSDLPISLSHMPAAASQVATPITETADHIIIESSEAPTLEISKQHFLQLTLHDSKVRPTLSIDGNSVDLALAACNYELVSSTQGASAVKISLTSYIESEQFSGLKLQSELTYWLHNGALFGSVSIVNSNAASHPAGKWDLGDTASFEIDAFNLEGDTTNPIKLALSDHGEIQYLSGDKIEVFQASSGKPNWNCANHVDKNNTVSLPFKGYQVETENGSSLHESQCQASIEYNCNNRNWQLELADFWQNFPSSVSISASHFCMSMLGSDSAPTTELQAGEKKTRYFSALPSDCITAHCYLGIHYTAETQSVPFFEESQKRAPLHQLIQAGVSTEHGFETKREEIDEFGWRHFGELYADHEKAESPDVECFVSHYNNQYDPINGMLYQWVLTQNKAWFDVSDALAKHVSDIDVYHTSKDKPEYSGGLFWHTDHYVQAYTATHRTYSNNQPSDIYEGHAGGGGPGGQHCYTSGLLLHYYLTGNEGSKQALLSICDWIERYYESDGTLVGWLFGIKNSGLEGLKNYKTGAYPLDRGTGNYIIALLDKYDLNSCQSDLDKCAHIIFNTVSPLDSFKERNLDNVELTWFYTVFLQAVCRFITVKERIEQNDAAYAHAVKSLLHYARWMARNEYPYLEKPDILEFPNETWTGQDLRKVCVLKFAAKYEESNKQALMDDKANSILDVIETRLSNSPESRTTRVLCLMMQNYTYRGYGNAPAPMAIERSYEQLNYLVKPSAFSGLLSTLNGFSFSRERQQLVKRFPALQRFLGRP